MYPLKEVGWVMVMVHPFCLANWNHSNDSNVFPQTITIVSIVSQPEPTHSLSKPKSLVQIPVQIVVIL